MTLPRQSKKRLQAIADGTYTPPKRKAMKRSKFTAKEGAALLAKPKKASKSAAKKRAWDIFSKWIRLRDAGPDGRVKCITCPSVKHWKDMDAGHYITRAKESTLFDEQNVSAQCGGCNRWQGGKFLEHARAIERKFGAGTRDRIERKAMQMCKRTLKDYQFIEATYKARVDWIKLHEPEKYSRCAG